MTADKHKAIIPCNAQAWLTNKPFTRNCEAGLLRLSTGQERQASGMKVVLVREGINHAESQGKLKTQRTEGCIYTTDFI